MKWMLGVVMGLSGSLLGCEWIVVPDRSLIPQTTTTTGSNTETGGSSGFSTTSESSTSDSETDTTTSSDSMVAVCGDGMTEAEEECDDENTDAGDDCVDCKKAVCGDGFLHIGMEECDDGNAEDTDDCTSLCQPAFCGDGFVQLGVEECDDANTSNTDGCVAVCVLATCGDGLIFNDTESCDDGNLVNGDGCEATCTITPGTVLALHASSMEMGYSVIKAIEAGKAGDAIVAGDLSASIDIGMGTMNTDAPGSYDGFVIVYGSDQSLKCAAQLGGAGDQTITALALDGSGDILVGGSFTGTLDVGNGPFATAIGSSIFVTKLDGTTCLPVWAWVAGESGGQRIGGIATDSQGQVLVAGGFSGTFDLGGGDITSAGDWDVFLVMLSQNGGYVAAQTFGNLNTQAATDVVVDTNDNILLTGYFDDSIDTGCGAVMGAIGTTDIFVTKFAFDGVCQWSKSFGDEHDQWSRALGVDSLGNVFVTGGFIGTVNFGGATLTSSLVIQPQPQNQVEFDGYLAAFAPDGNHLFSKKLVNMGGEFFILDMAVDPTGNIALAGYYQNGINLAELEGGTLDPVGFKTAFLMEIDAAGKLLLKKSFGEGIAAFYAIAFSSQEALLVGGNFGGSYSFDSASPPLFSPDRDWVLMTVKDAP